MGFAAVVLGGCLIDSDQPDLAGQDVRLTIIHTADIHSRLFPYDMVPNSFDQGYGLLPVNSPFGGIARISTMVKRIRVSAERSLWLDSGDAWEGAAVFNEFKGEAEIRSLSLAGMEGEVLGNHEFDLGTPQLVKELNAWSQFPHLVADYAWEDPSDSSSDNGLTLQDLTTPFQIYDVEGLKIGVIGLGNEDTLLSSYMGNTTLGFRPIDPGTALQQYVALLRPVCDLVVVLSHLGLDDDEGLSASQVDDPNASLPNQNVDLILGGHLHIVTNPPKLLPADDGSQYCVNNDCETLLIHSGAFAKYVGRIDLVVHVSDNGDNADPEHRTRITNFAYVNQPVDSTIPDDPDMANFMWPYSVQLNQDIDLNGVFSYVDPPGTATITRNDASGGDSQLGNMVARAMQLQQGVDAQFAFTNSLGIRADFNRGPLTNEQMFNVFPFENTIVVLYMSGQEVQDTLDFVAQESSQRGCKSQLQQAGITWDMVCRDDPTSSTPCKSIDPAVPDTACAQDTDCPSGDRCDTTQSRCVTRACAQNIFIGDNCRPLDPNTGMPNTDAPVDPATTPCTSLSPDGLYRVAVNNYIAAGGSGFIVLQRNTSQQDTGVSLRDSLTVFLTQEPAICDGMTTAQILDFTDTEMNTKCAVASQCPSGTCTNGIVTATGDSQVCNVLPASCMCAQGTIQQLWGNISCLDETIEAHDGRIRPVFQ
ncbi:MAG TPA: 5'-nucleotidase C-terminal domain-containing protein [Kofleriaceae bacterium]|nr:5'-nucleotidase C-terminal domain-containing protein [Kofleriaceae bacterium]